MPYFALGSIFFLCTISQHLEEGDWKFFNDKRLSIGPSLFDQFGFALERFTTWSSRILFEFLTLAFSGNFVLFSIISALCAVLLSYSIANILKVKSLLGHSVVCAAFLFIVPFGLYYTAGYYATMINGLWGLALAMYTVCLLLQTLDGVALSRKQFFLGGIAALVSVQIEQCAILIFCFSVAVLLFKLYKKIRRWTYDILLLCISIAGVVVVLVCPGNRLRSNYELIHAFPEYSNIGLLNKLQLGLDTTSGYFFITDSLLLNMILLALVGAAVVKGRYLALLPVIIIKLAVFLIANVPFLDEMFLYVKCYNKFSDGPKCLSFANLHNINTIIVPAVLLSLFVLLALAVFLVYGPTRICGLTLLFFAVGTLTHFMLAFSPSVFNSMSRTFLIMWVLSIVSGLLIAKETFSRRSRIQPSEQIML
ncbi:MAG: hypothetical protein LBQ41_02270 [Candidatus Ancillula sp.]|nr:hypothetical protein [Candidatus Ancillula sp.]